MAGVPFQVAVLLVLFHLVFSQQCPDGTPNGCQCQNRVFNCSGLGLNNMPASLSSLTDFNAIDLSNNNFGSVPTGAFRNLTGVQRIILMNNGITEIRSGGFDNLAQLTTINLRQNSLSILEQTGFNLVNNLNELFLDGNPVACDDAENAWLKGWMISLQYNSVITGNCAYPVSIEAALESVSAPSSAVFSFEEAGFNALEGNEKAVITVTRKGVSTTRVEFDLTTFDGTAVSNVDFMPPLNSKHTMLEGQTRMDIDILLVDDELREDDETFTVTITIQSRGEANMGTIGTHGTATVTIQDNDGPTTVPPIATTANPETSTEPSTESNAERTDRNMITDDTNQTLEPNASSVNVAAIVVPIVLIIVIIAVIIGYLWYRRSRTVNKGTTAGV